MDVGQAASTDVFSVLSDRLATTSPIPSVELTSRYPWVMQCGDTYIRSHQPNIPPATCQHSTMRIPLPSCPVEGVEGVAAT